MPEKLIAVNKLFNISRGNKLDLNKTERCSGNAFDAVAFINRSGERNGVAAFVRPIISVQPYEAGLITVALGGSALSSFVQPRKFYTGQNVDVLTPVSTMSLDEKLFYCLCIEANRFRYSTFGREANRTLRDLLLPASAPSWVSGASQKAVQGLRDEIGSLI